jgi:cytidyltransferase-like protein
MNKKIVLVTGGFDPLHSGHLEYFQEAKKLGDILVVGVNSDEWLTRKKGSAFMPLRERINLIRNLKMVDFAISFDDTDGTAKHAIFKTWQSYPHNTIVFANGGDRTSKNILEMETTIPKVEFVFGVGGTNKINSSSWILDEWKAPKTERPWGYYRVLHQVNGTKVKELTIMPGQSLSMQKHNNRSEYWHVTEGKCRVEFENEYLVLDSHKNAHIHQGEWHKLSNPHDIPCRLVEIQYGTVCEEYDIERK